MVGLMMLFFAQSFTDNLYSLHNGLSPDFKSSMPVTASNAGEIQSWNTEVSSLLTGHVPEPKWSVLEQAQIPTHSAESLVEKHQKPSPQKVSVGAK